MLDARWRRRVGDDSHARCHMERVQVVAAHAHPLVSPLVALCEGQAGGGRFIQGPPRCAVITSGRTGAVVMLAVVGHDGGWLRDCHGRHQRNIPHPCALFEHLHAIALWGGVVFVRRQSSTLPTGQSHQQRHPSSKGEAHLPDPPAGCRSLFLITPSEPGPAIPGRSTLPTLPMMDSGTLFGSNQHETGGTLDWGPFFCPASPGSGLDRLFSRTS